MIKEILEQLAPLDAQIAALKGRGNDMEAITAHASELAELAVEEDEILRTCGPLTAEDRVFLARHPERPHIDEIATGIIIQVKAAERFIKLQMKKGINRKIIWCFVYYVFYRDCRWQVL